MDGIYLLLGSNLGNKEENLRIASSHLVAKAGKIIKPSAIYETSAWGETDQPVFLNQVIEIQTSLSPIGLLAALQDIEVEMGRIRLGHWKERIIDIDILYYHQQIIRSQRLTIPHPEMQNRRFTLVPLCEIAPEFMHPVLKKSNVALLAACKDTLNVERMSERLKD